MELGPHGGDAAAQNGLLAGLAHAAAGLVVVGLAQRFPLVFEEAAVDEGAVTLLEKQRKLSDSVTAGRKMMTFS